MSQIKCMKKLGFWNDPLPPFSIKPLNFELFYFEGVPINKSIKIFWCYLMLHSLEEHLFISKNKEKNQRHVGRVNENIRSRVSFFSKNSWIHQNFTSIENYLNSTDEGKSTEETQSSSNNRKFCLKICSFILGYFVKYWSIKIQLYQAQLWLLFEI